MISTITQGLTQGKTGLSQPVDRLLAQLRGAANRVGEAGPFDLTATSAAGAVLWESDELKPNSNVDITAYVRSVEATVPATNCVRHIIDASFVRFAGNASLIGSTDIALRNGAAGSAAFVVTADNTIQLQVTSAGVVTHLWSAWIETR